jgi:hypothetical protein
MLSILNRIFFHRIAYDWNGSYGKIVKNTDSLKAIRGNLCLSIQNINGLCGQTQNVSFADVFENVRIL